MGLLTVSLPSSSSAPSLPSAPCSPSLPSVPYSFGLPSVQCSFSVSSVPYSHSSVFFQCFFSSVFSQFSVLAVFLHFHILTVQCLFSSVFFHSSVLSAQCPSSVPCSFSSVPCSFCVPLTYPISYRNTTQQQQEQPNFGEMADGFNPLAPNAGRKRDLPAHELAQLLEGMRRLGEVVRQGFERLEARLDAM